MCGAAVACCCTCWTDADPGHATTRIRCVCRWVSSAIPSIWAACAPLMSSICQIVNEPPPMWEVPSNCNNFTAKVFRAGLRKDPERRASAKVLRRKTTKALRAGYLKPSLHVFNLQFYFLNLTYFGSKWIFSIFRSELLFLFGLFCYVWPQRGNGVSLNVNIFPQWVVWACALSELPVKNCIN